MMSPRAPYSHFAHVGGAEGAVAQAKVILQDGAVCGRIDLTVPAAKYWQVSVPRHVAPTCTMVIGNEIGIGAKRVRSLRDVRAANPPLTYKDWGERVLPLEVLMIGTRIVVVVLVIHLVGRVGMGLVIASEAMP